MKKPKIKQEIERKWLVEAINPELVLDATTFDMIQFYRKGGLRIRRKTKITPLNDSNAPEFQINFKGPGSLVRDEQEMTVTPEAYSDLIDGIKNAPIHKRIYIIPLNKKLELEIHIFMRQLSGLILLEIEFPSKKSAKKFKFPKQVKQHFYKIKDVTEDSRYKNFNLFQLGKIPKKNPNKGSKKSTKNKM